MHTLRRVRAPLGWVLLGESTYTAGCRLQKMILLKLGVDLPQIGRYDAKTVAKVWRTKMAKKSSPTRLKRGHALHFPSSGRVIVEPVSQIHLTLQGDEQDAVFRKAQGKILNYIRRRADGVLPPGATKGESFAIDEVGTRRVDAVSIDTPRYWALRFDDDDRDVPGRIWVIETSIARDDDGGTVLFGLRLQCVAHGKNPRYIRSVPTVVRDVVKACDARLDDRKVSVDPWFVNTEKKVDDLVSLLCQKNRTADVIVISLPENSNKISDGLISGRVLSTSLAGTTHVVVLSGKASYHLSDRIGKEFSVFHQGVRTYRPGFDPENQSRSMHPLCIADKIRNWGQENEIHGGPNGYEKFLVSEALKFSIEGIGLRRKVPTFSEVKRVKSEIDRTNARMRGASDKELMRLYEDDNIELTKQVKQLESEIDEYVKIAEADLNNAKDENQRSQDIIYNLQSRIQSLEVIRGSENVTSTPENLDQLEEWALRELSGSVELHNRALRGAKRSQYQDVSLIFKALLLLRDHYVPMRRFGDDTFVQSFKQGCKELGITEASTFSGPRAGEQGDEYVIRYGTKRIFLDRHLKKGNSRTPSRCFRLYFHWDADTRQVIVGWLPSHLTTRDS